MSSSERTVDIRKDRCYCISLYFNNLIYVYYITATKFFTQFCDSHNAHFSKGIHSLRWQICTRNNVLALSKDATRHVHQKSKKLAQNPKVPKELQDPIRKQRSLHIPSRSVGDIRKGKLIFWNLHNSFYYYLYCRHKKKHMLLHLFVFQQSNLCLYITATKKFTQFCDSHNAHFSKGIHSLRWQICTRNNVLALSKDATRHVHQKSKKLAQNPKVPKELQDPIRKQRSLHIWHMLSKITKEIPKWHKPETLVNNYWKRWSMSQLSSQHFH